MDSEDKIDYIEMPARDPQKAWNFFHALFGWTFEDYGPDYCAFTDGRMTGGFYRADATFSTENGAPLIVFYNADLNEAAARVVKHGGSISRETYAFPGGSRFHFLDPNGNEFAIWSDKHDGADA